MVNDNKDRYGYRHREDPAYEMGESKPGDVGDSEGTFHDRAGTDTNVIVDGEVRNYEKHKEKQTSETVSTDADPDRNQNQSHSKTKQGGQFAELDGTKVEVTVDRISGSGNPIATYRGIDVHVPQGKPGKTYDVELEAQSGYFVGQIQVQE